MRTSDGWLAVMVLVGATKSGTSVIDLCGGKSGAASEGGLLVCACEGKFYFLYEMKARQLYTNEGR